MLRQKGAAIRIGFVEGMTDSVSVSSGGLCAGWHAVGKGTGDRFAIYPGLRVEGPSVLARGVYGKLPIES